jgi:dTMP kinase
VLLVVVSRAERARRVKPAPDRIEASGEDFHRRVEDGFLALARADFHRWVVIDGDGPIDEVADKVWAAVQSHSLP